MFEVEKLVEDALKKGLGEAFLVLGFGGGEEEGRREGGGEGGWG